MDKNSNNVKNRNNGSAKPRKTDKIKPEEIPPFFPIKLPESERERIEAVIKQFNELHSQLKKRAIKGQFSSKDELCKEYIKVCRMLQRESKTADIFDHLLKSWFFMASGGQLNLKGIEDYMEVSHELGLPIDYQKLNRIMGITEEKLSNNQESEMIPDDHYCEILNAAAEEYVQIGNLKEYQITKENITSDVEELIKTVKLVRLAQDRCNDDHISGILANELQSKLQHYERITNAVVYSGINDALSMGNNLIIRELRYSALPEWEHEFLQQCGISNTEGYLRLLVVLAKENYFSNLSPEYVFNQGREVVESSINNMKKQAPDPDIPQKKRKVLLGVAKILLGVGTAGANVGAAIGTSGVSAIAGAIASVGSGIVSIHEGVSHISGDGSVK